jgi:ATPase subunit of ABC transporter with duplicated ATPase domains
MRPAAVRHPVRRAAGEAADPAARAGGATLLLLDEPTDNLDLPSAEALQQGLESYRGTVLAVTHDRWFARSFDRFLIFTPDGDVREATEPAWD